MASTSNEEGQMLKKHVISTEVIETIEVNGHYLQDKKHQILSKASENDPKMTRIIHSRSIDDRSYAVQWIIPEGEDEARIVETEMTQEEVQRFEKDWCNMWNPVAKADLD